METVYDSIVSKVRDGAAFKADFKNAKIFLNNKEINLQGESLGIDTYASIEEWLSKVELLYDNYKHSRPSKTSMAHERKAKFKALDVSALIKSKGHMALLTQEDRNESQAKLESFIVLSIINGSLKPQELFATKWFYQGSDKSFIMRKEWF